MSEADRRTAVRSASYAVQLLGVVIASGGVALWHVAAGLALLGLGLVALGVSMELG